MGSFFFSFFALRRFRTPAQSRRETSASAYRAILDSTADGILVVDQQGRIASYNRKFVEQWRIPEAVMATGDDELALTTVLDQLTNPQLPALDRPQLTWKSSGLTCTLLQAVADQLSYGPCGGTLKIITIINPQRIKELAAWLPMAGPRMKPNPKAIPISPSRFERSSGGVMSAI